MAKIYFSTDIETNGLAAGLNSMISLGVAAIDMETGEIVGTFKRNIFPVNGLFADSSTMEWWKTQPEAWKRTKDNQVLPEVAMMDLEDWVKTFGQERNVLAAWKPGFDVAFIRYYNLRFLGRDVFGRTGSGLDIKTLAAIALNQPFAETQIGKVPEWLKGTKAEHNHDALDDAIEQAHVMYNAIKKLGVNL